MTKTKGILQTELYYAEHLDAVRDKKDIEAFTINFPEGQGLSTYLKDYALKEEARVMRTYLVRDIDTDELVGYFSLKAGLASINESVTEVADEETGRIYFQREFDTVPGVELANFAVNSKYVEKYPYHKGLGRSIFNNFVIPVIKNVEKSVGVTMVYIYALPYERLIERYKAYGFRRLPENDENDLHTRLKPRYDESCKFMYMLLD